MKNKEIAQIESELRHFRVEMKEQAANAAEESTTKKGVPSYVIYLLATLICVIAYNF